MNRRSVVAALASAGLALRLGALARADDTPREVRIGYQKIGALLVLKERGTLETRLAPQHVNVTWVPFQSGPPLIEALNAGAIDFGYTGDTPPIFAQAAGVNFVYVASIPQPGQSNAILVRADARINALGDLRGKRIAVVKGSSGHSVLIAVLRRAHVRWDEITPVYLQPADAAAALAAGSVDAWSIWDPFYAVGQRMPNVRVLTDAVGIAPSNAFFVATRDFATRNPAVVRTLVQETAGAWHWAQQHPAELADVLARASGVDISAERVVAARTNFEVGFMTAAVVRRQQEIADTFGALGLIPHAVRIEAVVWYPSPALTASEEHR